MSAPTLVRPQPQPAPAHRLERSGPPTWWPRAVLALIVLGQAVLAVTRPIVATPFEDEGLYVYVGHSMIDHLLHGSEVPSSPGSYFSGAPGFYPVLAALGDSVGGLAGARTVSLVFALAATLAVAALARELFGRGAGLLAAASFAVCGSVLFQAWFATFDSLMLALLAAAAWLTVRSVRRDRFLLAPVVAALLVAAFYAKYAAAAYVPVVGLLALAAARPGERVLVLRRTVVMVLSAAATGFFVFALWGQSLGRGIAVTTTSRTILNPASPASMLTDVALWVGPWLLLAVLGAVALRRELPVSAVLLLGAVLGPLGQVRIGESTSLAKHVAFGMVFACPLVGVALVRLLGRGRERWVTAPLVALVLAGLTASGAHYSAQFRTGWVSDAAVLGPLRALVAANPGKTVLGEQPAAERYALREVTEPGQWTDTYSFGYDGLDGVPAYQRAVDQSAFGVIVLTKDDVGRVDGSPTPNGAALYDYLTTAETPYRPATTVPRTDSEGRVVGSWVLFAPRVTPLPAGLAPAVLPG